MGLFCSADFLWSLSRSGLLFGLGFFLLWRGQGCNLTIEDATQQLSSEDSMGMPSLKLPSLRGQMRSSLPLPRKGWRLCACVPCAYPGTGYGGQRSLAGISFMTCLIMFLRSLPLNIEPTASARLTSHADNSNSGLYARTKARLPTQPSPWLLPPPSLSQCPALPFTQGLAVLSQWSAESLLKYPLTTGNVNCLEDQLALPWYLQKMGFRNPNLQIHQTLV